MGFVLGLGNGIVFRQGGSQNWSSYWASLISATVENNAPTNVVMTFPSAKPTLGASDFTIAGFTISSASWTGAVLTLILSTRVYANDSLVVTFVPSGGTANVTNNVLNGFVTEWTTTAPGETITLPLYNSGVFNATIDWGDGGATSAITAYNDGDRVHTYTDAGTYIVEITGECPGWSFNSGGDRLKIRRIITWGDVTSFGGFQYLSDGFSGCSNLTSTGVGKILAKAGLTSLLNLFYQCAFTSVQSGIFDNCVNVQNMRGIFYACTNLVTVPSGIFDKNTAATMMRGIFQSCTSLESVPQGIFDKNKLVTTQAFYFGFNGCSSLTALPPGLFKYNTAVAENAFDQCFTSCVKLETIYGDMFEGAINASSNAFYKTFQGCAKLAAIPAGLFDTCVKVSTKGFHSTFLGCDAITSIPIGLFDNCPLVSTDGFLGTFESCDNLLAIPAGLFDNNVNVAGAAFQATFLYCPKITSIPTGLFDNNTGNESFYWTFAGCGITTVPQGLFRPHVNVTTFRRTFWLCSKLQLNKYIFYNEGEQATRFLNKTVSFEETFNLDAAFTGTQGTAPDLWTCNFGTGSATPITDCYDGHSLASVDNFGDIPAGWT
jgi:hypothetical protein